MKHLILLALAVGAFACNGTKRTEAAQEPSPVEQVAENDVAQAPRFGGNGKADSLFLYLERTPCFGTCKAYRIDLYRSGYATFDGRGHVEKMGLHSARIGADTLSTLLNLAEQYGFHGFESKYDAEVTDIASTLLRIAANGRDKQVLARVGQPQAFKKLVSEIEGLLLPVAWKPVVQKP